jgi:hypothetical protein
MVCIDGSENAIKALEFALKMFQPKDNLVLYSCFPTPDTASDLFDVSESLIVQPALDREELAKAQAEKKKQSCLDALNIAHKKVEVSTVYRNKISGKEIQLLSQRHTCFYRLRSY